MGTAEPEDRAWYPSPMRRVSIRCREMGTAERERVPDWRAVGDVSIRCREMGTAERPPVHSILPSSPSGFYSLSRDGDSGTHWYTLDAGKTAPRVSIRCREMGTAERWDGDAVWVGEEFLFAVARWGQRNRRISS